jgi:hypothetical protein
MNSDCIRRPGGVFRIQQAALERVALGRRQLFQDLFLVLLVEAFEQFDGVVGFEFANALATVSGSSSRGFPRGRCRRPR